MRSPRTKFVFVTGGVISGIGKGITAASLGRLLISQGYSVFPIKMDPYLNEDAGTMNPFQHGEVFVTDDGAETDLDLGHYERFMSVTLDRRSNFTSGSVFRSVLDKERRGSFLGKTIQFVPHITDEIQNRILAVANKEKPDFIFVEIGGTIGADIEIQPFVEAVRQLSTKVGRNRFASIHVVKMDYVFPSDEAKTKPIQHSVRAMLNLGLIPDILIVRAKRPIGSENLEKISLFCGIPKNRIVEALDADNIYQIPLKLKENGLLENITSIFDLPKKNTKLTAWKKQYKNLSSPKSIRIGIVGKYHHQSDAYISVNEALRHAAAENKLHLDLVAVDSESKDLISNLKTLDGMVIPGGYGHRGVPGMIKAVEYARLHKIPFLGLCLGLQIATIEYARNVLHYRDADSTEINPNTKHPVIDILTDQKDVKSLGGSQRLGSYQANIFPQTIVHQVYKKKVIYERHRHRYEVNPKYHQALTKAGLVISGLSPDKRLVEFIELPQRVHPFYVATQSHPEFKSRFIEPHPLFVSFIKAAKDKVR